MENKPSKYITYMLRGLPAGLFGESYVVVAGTTIAQDEYLAEHFILTQRPNEALQMGALKIVGTSIPEELGKVDIDFAMAEAFLRAENDLVLLLESRAAVLKRPDSAYLPFELKQCHSPFVGCRMRGRFKTQLMEIKDATKCPPMAQYFELLQQVGETK